MKPKIYTEKEVVEMILTLREELSDLEHQQWAHWADHLLNLSREEFGKNMERWHRQINTDYKNLSEKEKDSDREWADKVIKLINSKFMTVRGFRKSIEDAGLVGTEFINKANIGGEE